MEFIAMIIMAIIIVLTIDKINGYMITKNNEDNKDHSFKAPVTKWEDYL